MSLSAVVDCSTQIVCWVNCRKGSELVKSEALIVMVANNTIENVFELEVVRCSVAGKKRSPCKFVQVRFHKFYVRKAGLRKQQK